MLLRSSTEASVSTQQLTCQCTCVIETESDSDNDSDNECNKIGNEVAGENGLRGGSSRPPPSKWSKSLSLQTASELIQNSQALHNAENLRQATVLDNVFCSLYDVDTVLHTVQRREERGQFTPLQKLLLAPESVEQVFGYATSGRTMYPNGQENRQQYDEKDPNRPNAATYRQAFVATEIILHFYLKVVAWYGEPKADLMEDSGKVVDTAMQKGTKQEAIPKQSRTECTEQTVPLTQASPSKATSLMDFQSNTSTRKMARIQRLRANMRFESSGSSISDFSGDGNGLIEDPSTRGYLLRFDDLTANEWKRIFGKLFLCFCPQLKFDGDEKGENSDDGVEVDSVLAANMCTITKNFVVFPGVHRLICDEDKADEKEWLISRLAAHAYNPDIASLLHGLIHLSFRRGFDYFLIIRCLVQRIVEHVPTQLVRSLSSASLTSTVSSTASASPRSSIDGFSTVPSFSFFSSKTASFPAFLSTSNTVSIVYSRISGCAEILSKILEDELPDTFRYYIQRRIQVASFESVEPFERELFPSRVAPSDPVMHHKLKNAVLAALVEDSTVLARLAELGMAELRYLDAHHINEACIPSILVIDVLRHAVEFSMHTSEPLEAFVAPIHLVLGTICASINYHQHLSTILEFAARGCFSDSDSDDGETEDGDFALHSHSSEKDDSSMPLKRNAPPAQSTLFMGITLPAISCSPSSGKTIVNYRPLASTLLVMHVVELLDVVILMSNDRIDSRLTRLDIATSLMQIFEKFPTASILHCRLVKLYLNLLNRPSSNGRVNNPLLRSIFRSPDSILEFIISKLDTNTSAHVYDAHLAIIGVKIATICSSATLQQELIRQFCNNVKGWNDFASSLVATHYEQMDVLNDSLLGLQVSASGAPSGGASKRKTNEDNADRGFLLARPSSSASEYLSRELDPFRRLPMEKEGFGSSQNLARGNEAVHPSDMFQSRLQSKFPKPIIDILQSDASTSSDVEEDDCFVSGYAYQKHSRWAKVYLRFDKATCQLTLQHVSVELSQPPSSGASKSTSQTKVSRFQQLLMAHKQAWTSRPKRFVVCNARRWIVFRRGIKKRNRGAFGFQIEVFDSHREEDETLTFVTGSDVSRTRWVEVMQSAVTRTWTSRNGSNDINEAFNLRLVECVAKNCDGPYLVVPDVNLLGPMTSASFLLKSVVPEEVPFWGTYHGDQGISKYASLLNQCLDVVLVEEKNIEAIGFSVTVEFDATFRRSENNDVSVDMEPPSVKCSCTDTYLINGNQIIGLTRTIADSKKLLQLLCDEQLE